MVIFFIHFEYCRRSFEALTLQRKIYTNQNNQML